MDILNEVNKVSKWDVQVHSLPNSRQSATYVHGKSIATDGDFHAQPC